MAILPGLVLGAADMTFLVTTPIYYVNDKPHIGHAYTSVAADVVARWRRLKGEDCFLLTGTDEHGQKIVQSARARGVDDVLTFVDWNAETFRGLADRFEISYNDFIRTTELRHKTAVTALWQRLHENGYIYPGSYEGWYATRDEAFYSESDTILLKGVRIARETGAEVQWVSEPSYFFRLSAFRTFLLNYLHNNPTFVWPQSRYNEVLSIIEGGLTDLCIGRANVTWGIPVPDDASQTVYVWLDALTNYISALGYPNDLPERWQNAVHIVGKDIVKFHAIFWPAFLHAAGLPLPKQIVAHGWWTNKGQKISKSLGNVIDPVALADEYGLDAVRYFLLREVPFGEDGDFSEEKLIQRADSDLANDLGNLAHRVLTLVQKFDYGCLAAECVDVEHPLLSEIDSLPTRIDLLINGYRFDEALSEIWVAVRVCNVWVNQTAPWAIKDAQERSIVLRALVDALRIIATVLQAFIPHGADRLLTLLAIPSGWRSIEAVQKLPVPVGTRLPAPEPVFRRIRNLRTAA